MSRKLRRVQEPRQTGFIYLAMPIDQTGGELATILNATRAPIKQNLNRRGWGVYDPAGAFNVGDWQQPTREIQSINNFALGRCRGMVAVLPDGVATIGVPIEIDRAANNGIPVYVYNSGTSWALAMYSTRPNVQVHTDIEGGVEWLVGQAERASLESRVEPLPFAQLRDDGPDEYGGVLPTRAHDGDAGYDLHVSRTVKIEPGEMVDVPCNLAVQLPDWSWGLLVGRSSTLRTKGLQVHTGIVDSGYRGELFAAVSTLGGEPVQVNAGDRLAQLIVMSNHSRLVRPQWARALADSDRGVRGFGSTGV